MQPIAPTSVLNDKVPCTSALSGLNVLHMLAAVMLCLLTDQWNKMHRVGSCKDKRLLIRRLISFNHQGKNEEVSSAAS